MSKRSREDVIMERKEKKAQRGKVVKEKFQNDRDSRIIPVQPKNENQRKYLESMQRNVITVARGRAGTGKTYLAASFAANMYLKGDIHTIVLLRPLVGMGRSSGFWPGTIQQKIEPYVAPMLSTIKERIGTAKFEADYGKSIVIQPMEAVRGMSFSPGVCCIIDETQNTTPDEIRSLVTRLEEGAIAIFCGDDRQKDLNGLSGIEYLCNLIKNNDIPDCGVVEFTSDDIVRSGLTRTFVELFEKEGPAPK